MFPKFTVYPNMFHVISVPEINMTKKKNGKLLCLTLAMNESNVLSHGVS